LYYQDVREFGAALDIILDRADVARALGAAGRQYYERHYSWPVIVRKYLDMFDMLSDSPPQHRLEPLPGFFARRRRTLPPATRVVDALPTGPVRELERTPALKGVGDAGTGASA
jgi:hypothetical protein